MRRFLPFVLGALGVAVFAAAGWAVAAAVDGDDPPLAVAPAEADAEPETIQMPVTELVEGDLDEAGLDEQAAVELEAPPEGVDPLDLAEGSEGEVPDDAPDGSDTPVPTRGDAVRRAGAPAGDRVVTVVEPRLTDLPPDEADREGWRDHEGSDAEPPASATDEDAASATDEDDLAAGALDDLAVVEIDQEGAPPAPPPREDDRTIDLCAGPEPVEGCPEGVGGTVSLAVVGPFDIIGVVGRTDDRCDVRSSRDRYVLTIRSSAPGRFHIRTTPAPVLGEPQWSELVEVQTAPEEVARWEEDEEIVVQTCVALPLARDDDSFRVEMLGNPLVGDGAGDGWTGEITPLQPIRPTVQFRATGDRPGSNDALGVVSSRADEQVELVRILREPGQTTSACHRIDNLRAADYPRMQVVEGRAGMFSGVGTPPFPNVWIFEMRRLATQGTDICITWFRDLSPHREVVERQAWVLRPPVHPSVSIVLGEATTDAGAPARMGAVGFWLSDRHGRELCRSYLSVEDLGEVCRLDTTYDLDTAVVHLQGSFGGSSGVRRSHALELQQQPCASCGGWARMPIAGPDGAPRGSVRIHVRYANETEGASVPPSFSGLSGTWRQWWWWQVGTFGDESGRGGGEEDVPRLDLSRSSVHYDQTADPFALTVRWVSDRPVMASVSGVDPSGRRCRSDRAPGEVRRVGDPQDAPATSGEVVFDACPGVTHHFAVSLHEPGGGTSTFSPDGEVDLGDGAGREDEAVHRWPNGRFTVPALPVDVTYGTRLRLGGFTGWHDQPPGSRQPSMAHVDWWTEVGSVRFSQSRRSGFIVHNSPTCDALTNFDLAPATVTPTPIRIAAGPQVPVSVDAAYSLYSACRLIQVPASEPIVEGGAVLHGSAPLYDMVHRAPATITRTGQRSNFPDDRGCSFCVPNVYADVSATVAPRA